MKAHQFIERAKLHAILEMTEDPPGFRHYIGKLEALHGQQLDEWLRDFAKWVWLACLRENDLA